MEYAEILNWLYAHLPETILLIGGFIALLIVATYLKDKESTKYKAMVALGLVFGAVMAYEAIVSYGVWSMPTSIIVAVAAFALIIRPFREVHVAIILSVFVMAIIYILMAGLNGTVLFGQFDLTFLSTGWPRAVVAFVAGAFVYLITNFAEELVKLFGKLLNYWPVLGVLAIICIAEAAFMLTGRGSLADYIDWSSITSLL